jgi:hypothetical protein
MPVDVQRLRIERHVGEQHVVHLRHRAAQRVLVELADLEASKYMPPRFAWLSAARISGATTDIATRVTGAIRDAARATGAGFEYLLNTAHARIQSQSERQGEDLLGDRVCSSSSTRPGSAR